MNKYKYTNKNKNNDINNYYKNEYKTTIFKKKDLEKLEIENNKLKQKMIYNTYQISEEIRKTKLRLKFLEKEKININKKYEKDKLDNFKKILYDKINKTDYNINLGGDSCNLMV